MKVRKVKSLGSLAENPNHRERQLAHANGLSHGIVLSKNAFGKLRGDKAHLAAHLHVRRVEIPPAKDEQSSDGLIPIRHPHHTYRTLRSTCNHGHREFPRSCNLDHIGDDLGSLHVFQRHFITQWLRLIRPLHQLHPDQVRADAFDPRKHKFLASDSHGDDKNDGSTADDHPQRRQDRAQFVRAQRVDCHRHCLSNMHHHLAEKLLAKPPETALAKILSLS